MRKYKKRQAIRCPECTRTLKGAVSADPLWAFIPPHYSTGKAIGARCAGGGRKVHIEARSPAITEYTHEAWSAEATRRFGEDSQHWRFVCPSCGHEACVKDWQKAGAPESAVAFSCVGCWLPKSSVAFSEEPGPCNYAGGGLFKINPITVVCEGKPRRVFAFAPATVTVARNEES